jgi:DNA-binding NarL/FixJ family response regulator
MRRVVLVDDHALFRAGVRSELEGRVEVVGEAGTVDEAVALIERAKPDVVLLDVHMPDGGGVEVARRMGGRVDIRFLALSVSDAPEDVIAVIRAGARGYVTKTIDAERLADAIERVAEGDAVFSPRLAGFVLDAFRGDPTPGTSELDQLTPASRRSCASSRAAICTRRWPSTSASAPRPSRPTSPPCCASSSSPIATSSAAGRWSRGSTSS